MTVEWEADSYQRQPLPHQVWGRQVIGRARLVAGESLTDAGCGAGRDAEVALGIMRDLAAVAGVEIGQLTLLDSNSSMIESTRERFRNLPDSEKPLIARVDLLERWPLKGPTDVVISVATIHWIDDHSRFFKRAAEATSPVGRLHVDCGGLGNILDLSAAAHRLGIDRPNWNFPGVDETVSVLRRSGWVPDNVWLTEDPLRLPDPVTFREFLRAVVLHGATPEQLDGMEVEFPDHTVDYVRLNIDAHRA